MAGPRWAGLLAAGLGWAVIGCEPGPVQKVGEGSTIPQPPRDTSTATTPQGDLVCDARDDNGTCTEYPGPQWDDASIFNSCVGDVAQGPCPAADLGECSFEPTGPLASIVGYYSGVYYTTADIPSLSSDCYQSYGTWQ
jgi:hypothetical protein